jgi:hypothetical protein
VRGCPSGASCPRVCAVARVGLPAHVCARLPEWGFLPACLRDSPRHIACKAAHALRQLQHPAAQSTRAFHRCSQPQAPCGREAHGSDTQTLCDCTCVCRWTPQAQTARRQWTPAPPGPAAGPGSSRGTPRPGPPSASAGATSQTTYVTCAVVVEGGGGSLHAMGECVGCSHDVCRVGGMSWWGVVRRHRRRT